MLQVIVLVHAMTVSLWGPAARARSMVTLVYRIIIYIDFSS